MATTRAQKDAQLTELRSMVDGKAIVFTGYRGLSVHELDELRKTLRSVGARYRVTKTTLLRKALEERGIAVPAEILNVQLGIATSATDEVDPNRVVVEFGKTHNLLAVLGAVVDGKFVDAEGVATLAALPSREQLYGMFVGTVAAPLSGLVNVLAGNLRGLVTVLKNYEEKQSASA